MTLMGYALAAVRQGFHVFPVEPGGKTPGRLYPNRLPEEAPWTVKWSMAATRHVPQVVQWWNAEPWFNVGIACAPSGLLVVDCDVKNGDGLQEWADICVKFEGEESWRMFETYTVNTGSGGAHFYYRWPPYVQASQSGISTNVDIRSNGGEKGGYVLGAGSVTVKGSYGGEADAPIYNAPPWLVDLCKERPRPKPVRSIYQTAGPLTFSGLVTMVAMASEGNRNQALFVAARKMQEEGASLSLILELLVPAAVDNGLTEREATSSAKSGYDQRA